jgi:hypothetical protein
VSQNRKYKTIQPPIGGLAKRTGFTYSPPFYTPDCLNVWPRDAIDGRERIGSRPGLYDTSVTDLGNAVNMLSKLVYINSSNVRVETLVAAENGDLFTSPDGITWTGVATGSSLALATDVLLHAEYRNGLLYIADYDDSGPAAFGTNGTSNGAGTLLDSGTYGDWTDLPGDEINIHDYVVAIDSVGAGSDATIGIYQISSIHATNGITTTTAFASGSEDGIKFRVLRCPKIYDPVALTLTRMIATSGNVPCGHPAIALYRDRVFFAGGSVAPHNWEASKSGSPLNWDTSQVDPLRAVSGQGSDTGQIGEPINAMMRHGDQCLIFGCNDSMWIMRGDPAFGGQVTNLSYEVGCLDKGAWCHTPNGETIFMSKDGLYGMPRGCAARSVNSISRELLPEKLINIDPAANRILMAYDFRYRGIHIWVVKNSSTATTDEHWWVNWWPKSRGFWPMNIADVNFFPKSILGWTPSDYHTRLSGSHSSVMLGGTDGKVRHFSADVAQDSSTTFNSHVVLGPISLGGQNGDAKIVEIMGNLDASSGNVDWEVRTGDSAEDATTNTGRETGEWNKAGRNRMRRVRDRGPIACVKLTNGATNSEWALEDITIGYEPAGRMRVRN